MKIAAEMRGCLRCPKCRGTLRSSSELLVCTAAGCGAHYPLVDGVPILINEERSAFAICDFVSRQSTTFHAQSRLERFFSKLLPELTRNWRAVGNYRRMAGLLDAGSKVLVVGCGELGNGIEILAAHPGLHFVFSDVALGSYTQIVGDSHDLPFEDSCFDAVIIQAVLEHVTDPPRAVEEVHRVLRDRGLVYAETPFMQQVHGGAYDFTRFTHLGHRRLFRQFAEVDSGIAVGPGTALAWSYQYFLLCFVRGHLARSAVKAFCRVTAFWLKYLDVLLMDKPASLDAASGYYFMGRKQAETLVDRELIGQYRGAVNTLPQKKFG